MSWNGMYPQHNCRVCNKPLNADGYHPAELYAGTYTGLCYHCQNAPAFVVETARDGAQHISYPPHCPAWRRDREKFVAYPDCEDCNGTGRHYVSRPDGEGGSYYVYCKTCLNRYYTEPLRVWASKCRRQIVDAGQSAFEDALRKAHCLTAARKFKRGEAPPEKQAAIDQARKETYARYAKLMDRYNARCKELNVWWMEE